MTERMQRGLPSSKWLSFDGWDYNGMKERLENALKRINKAALTAHAGEVTKKNMTMSEPFSAGQYWICVELVAADGTLAIARVRLPRHPETPPTITDQDTAYATQCEIATMRYVRSKLTDIAMPQVYAYEAADSSRAREVGAAYMIIEGFRGNTLFDVAFDMTQLPSATQDRIMKRWTKVQAQLATLRFSKVGSISGITEKGDPIIGKIASAVAEEFQNTGPFDTAVEYFTAAGEAAFQRSSGKARVGAWIFRYIVRKTSIFHDIGEIGSFPLNHMDLGTQNILVDEDFNLLAAIDWEFAQTAPWPVNHYPMPFPPPGSDNEQTLEDADHIAYKNVVRQEAARDMYRAAFRSVEEDLASEGRPLPVSFAEILDSPASRIYACLAKLGEMPEWDDELVRRMLSLAFEWDDARIETFIRETEEEVRFQQV